MLALTVVFYNYCHAHKSLGGRTPAMAAGLTDYRWTAADLLRLEMFVRSRHVRSGLANLLLKPPRGNWV
jgi:hypothetical protein